MKRLTFLAFVVLLAFAVPASAGTLNYDPNGNPPPPILGLGWFYDQINAALPALSIDSPYPFNFPFPTLFSITDDFLVGDKYTVFDFGVPVLVTALLGAMPPFGPGDPPGWGSPLYEKGQILLAPGPHLLTVGGNGGGGLPAGFFTRIDQVGIPAPEPATILILGIGIGALGLASRRRVK